jgi:hypothetical protein
LPLLYSEVVGSIPTAGTMNNLGIHWVSIEAQLDFFREQINAQIGPNPCKEVYEELYGDAYRDEGE